MTTSCETMAVAPEPEVGGEVRFATDAASRAIGLMGSTADAGMILLAPCRDIHTTGMRFPIDVAFIDENGLVLESHRAVGPFRRVRNSRAACAVERIAQCGVPWFKAGERVALLARECRVGNEEGSEER